MPRSLSSLAARLAVLAVAAAAFLPASSPARATVRAAPRTPVVGPCPDAAPEVEAARQEIVGAVNARRAEEGLEPLALEPVLCATAQERAREVAEAGTVESDRRAVPRMSRRLRGAGYEAQLWTERAILGYRPAPELVEQWRRTAERSYRRVALGDFEQVGVGVADAGGGTAVVLLTAKPRLSHLLEISAPLRDRETVRERVLARVNELRGAAGRAPVAADPALDRAAQAHAEDMLERAYFGHVTPDGRTPRGWALDAGYPEPAFLAENIAKGLFEPAEVVDRWFDSPGHQKNLLHRQAQETGLGVAVGDTEEGFLVLWVQLFARRR